MDPSNAAGWPSEATGVVVDFDEPRGWGTVRGDDGVEHWFHCTAIADGSRTIDVGAPVRYRLVAGRLGAWEAGDLRPCFPAGQPASSSTSSP